MKITNLRIIIVLCLVMIIMGGYSQGTFYDHYLYAEKQQKKGKTETARKYFLKAIEVEPNDEEQKRTYGLNFIDYFPNRELGIIYFNEGNHTKAKTYLTNSVNNSFTSRAQLYLNKIDSQLGGSVLAVSEKEISTPEKITKPPYIEIVEGSLKFTDKDGNRKIDASEQSTLTFTIKNSGAGPGYRLEVLIEEANNTIGLSFSKTTYVGTLPANDEKYIEIPVNANMQLQSGFSHFTIRVKEANGFGSDPASIQIETYAFVEPLVKVVDYSVTSQNGKTLRKKKPFDVQILVQNVGQGTARDVSLNVSLPDNVLCLSDNEFVRFPQLLPGEQQMIEISLITNNYYDDLNIPLAFDISEQHNKFSEDKSISLALNQAVSTNKVVVDGIDYQPSAIAIGSLSADIDKNIPVNPAKNDKRVALIIGNEDYSLTMDAEVNVDYARRDAEMFKEYARNVLGVEDNNIHLLFDATSGQMNREIDLVTAIVEKLGGDAELIFFYAGHGLSDEDSKTPYLIPVDVNATNLNFSIKLSDIYARFSKTGAKRITIFLDACFSGGGRNQGLLAARSVRIKPNAEEVTGNMVVFSASSETQSALPYHKMKHGMFTYFLLKKLQDTNGDVTYGELAQYLEDKIGLESLRENGKSQEPEVSTSMAIKDEWNEWKFID